jgi:hypothetical protein
MGFEAVQASCAPDVDQRRSLKVIRFRVGPRRDRRVGADADCAERKARGMHIFLFGATAGEFVSCG